MLHWGGLDVHAWRFLCAWRVAHSPSCVEPLCGCAHAVAAHLSTCTVLSLCANECRAAPQGLVAVGGFLLGFYVAWKVI